MECTSCLKFENNSHRVGTRTFNLTLNKFIWACLRPNTYDLITTLLLWACVPGQFTRYPVASNEKQFYSKWRGGMDKSSESNDTAQMQGFLIITLSG